MESPLSTVAGVPYRGHAEIEQWTRDVDQRGRFPRLQGANLEHNRSLLGSLERIAHEHGATVAQLAIAWALLLGEDIVPLIGARTRERLAHALGSLELVRDPPTLRRVEEAVPLGQVRGGLYDEQAMGSLDRER